MKTLRTLSLCSGLTAASLLGGCASHTDGPREFVIAPGAYAEAFEATREVLLDMDFQLERVDAASGVITTAPHFAQGLLEPWDETQSSASDEWEDAMNMQAREVRVTFSAPDGAQGPEPARLDETALTAAVHVTVLRQQRAGRRLDSAWVGGSTFSIDPALREQGGSNYLVPIRRDKQLESRLAHEIAGRLTSGAPQPAAPDDIREPDDAAPPAGS